jgi:hypothetical protein
MRFTTLLLASALATGCTFSPGEPWGTLEIALDVRFDPADREDEGRLRTATDYLLEVDAVSVDLTRVFLSFSEDSAPVVFDEANPPAGFSLCHGGHCHSDDGRLVDYEDIVRDLEGGGAEPPGLSMPVGERLELDDEPLAVPLDCGACALPATVVDDVRLELGRVQLTGRAFDARGERLPEDGVEFDLVYDQPVASKLELGEEVGPWSSPRLRIEVDYALPLGVLDLDWSAPDPAASYPELFAFDEESLVAEIER